MSAEQTVNDIITDARNFADESYDSATDLIQSAQNAAGGFVLLDPRQLNFATDPNAVMPTVQDPGLFSDAYYKPNTRPDSPALETFYLPVAPQFPDEPDALDTTGLFQFDKPVFDIGGFTGTVPVVDVDYTFPDVPTIDEYDDPVTTPLDLRDVPTVTVPTWNPNIEVHDPGDPPDLETKYLTTLDQAVPQFRNWVESYADLWLDRYAPKYHEAQAELESAIARGYLGNTAMPDAVEQQIFDRAVSRTLEDQDRADTEAASAFSKRGYKVPPLALNGALTANGQVANRAASAAARETAIERARLEHQHVQFVMQLSSTVRDGMRGQVIQYSNLLLSINGQAIEHSKTVAALAAQVYELLLRRFELDQRYYGVLADIFETEMKAAMADIEIFKIEMEAAKTKKDAELADVSVWEKKIDAQNTKINLYLGQLRGIAEQAGIERIKLEIFGEEVNAYNARVRGKEAEFGAYESAIRGDTALVNAQAQVVQTYAETVRAAKAKLDAEVAISDSIATHNKNLTDIFQAELGAYETDVRAEGSRFDGSVAAYRTALERYQTVLRGNIDVLRIGYDKERLDLEAARAQLNGDVQTLLTQGQIFQRQLALRAQTAMAGATAFGSMASSAVSAQNTMVNLVNETING
jgi:hypothetical protein